MGFFERFSGNSSEPEKSVEQIQEEEHRKALRETESRILSRSEKLGDVPFRLPFPGGVNSDQLLRDLQQLESLTGLTIETKLYPGEGDFIRVSQDPNSIAEDKNSPPTDITEDNNRQVIEQEGEAVDESQMEQPSEISGISELSIDPNPAQADEMKPQQESESNNFESVLEETIQQIIAGVDSFKDTRHFTVNVPTSFDGAEFLSRFNKETRLSKPKLEIDLMESPSGKEIFDISWEKEKEPTPVRVGEISLHKLYRPRNEDYVAYDKERGVFVVADGVGGGACGDVASRAFAEYALENVSPKLNDEQLIDVIRKSDRVVAGAIKESGAKKPGATTMVMAVNDGLTPEGKAAFRFVHTGDPRAYQAGKNADGKWEVKQITIDQTYENLGLQAPKTGKGSDPARMIGVNNVGNPDVYHVELEEGEMLLMMTDGMWHSMEAMTDSLEDALMRADGDPEKLPHILEEIFKNRDETNAVFRRDDCTLLAIAPDFSQRS